MSKAERSKILVSLGVAPETAAGLSDDGFALLLRALEERATLGKSTVEDLLWQADYRTTPVDIDQFIEDTYFLGGPLKKGEVIYPRWREIHREINDPERNITEVVLTGAIGTGKSFSATLEFSYDLYRISCLHSPQLYYGLSEGSMIVFGLYNVFKYKVGTTTFPVLKSFVETSPYFKEHFQRDPKVETTLRFPNKVQLISGSTALHAIGDNLYSALIDEANFMRESGTAVDEETRSQAMELHRSVQRRMESRFRTPGRLYLVSSKKHESSYTTDYIRKARNRPNVYIADLALWDAKPKSFYQGWDGRKFRVLVGTAVRDSRILKASEQVPEDAHIVEVPEKHRDAFEVDVEGCLRDIAGVETVATRPLIQNRERIMGCVDATMCHPFSVEEFLIGLRDDTTIEDYFNYKEALDVRSSQYLPKRNPGAIRFAHVDLGLTRDCCGVAVGHVSGVRRVLRARIDGSSYETTAPEIEIDCMLRIRAPIGDEIDMAKVRAFFAALRQYGYALATISYDSWQSADSLQILTKEGFTTEKLSVDKTDEPYLFLRQAIMETRIRYYHYVPFLDEVRNVEHHRDKHKVDHPDSMLSLRGEYVRGSKDVSDAVAAVVYHCVRADVAYNLRVHPEADVTAKPSKGIIPVSVPIPTAVAPPKDADWLVSDYPDADRIASIEPRR